MPINSRTKGAQGERELAKVLNSYGYDTKRGVQFSQGNGNLTNADVIGLDGVHIECKRVEHLNIYDALEQSIRDAKDNETPVVIHRKNNKKWIVTMRLEDFMEYYGNQRSIQ